MATSNFYNKNASNIFAVEVQEEFEYEDLIENVVSEIRNDEDHYSSSRDEYQNDGIIIQDALSKTKYYADNTNIEVMIHPIVRSGYYAGVNLDWEYDFFIDGADVEDAKDIEDYLYEYEGYSPRKAYNVAESRFKQLEKIKDKLTERLEKIFKNYTTPLAVTARFSNGETIYERA